MFTDVQLLQIKNAVMRALHVPGNYRGGILEMAVAVDYHMDCEQLREECGQLAAALKRTDEIFRNVRLNLIKWVSDDEIIKEVSSLPALQLGKSFEDYEPEKADGGKSLDELLRQLKLFYARSKIIILITDGSYMRQDEEKIREYLHPFLGRKLVVVTSGQVSSGREWLS
ncbi:MAG: hypothetical protein K2O16_09895 [Lachnospiraceae bacterium]|nr:hypothetical protein [Lachnospiraceae bacterium]